MTTATLLEATPAEPSMRGPGCSERCEDLRVLRPGLLGRAMLVAHDPDAHQQYGRLRALGLLGSAPVILTGALSVDLQTLEVTLSGRPVSLTATELRLLVALARRLGQTCWQSDLLRSAWGIDRLAEGSPAPRPSDAHLLRVNAARLRAKLGAEARLLVTVKGIGYRLEAVPPTGGALDDD